MEYVIDDDLEKEKTKKLISIRCVSYKINIIIYCMLIFYEGFKKIITYCKMKMLNLIVILLQRSGL